MRFCATVKREHEPVYAQLVSHFKHNKNEMLAMLFRTLIVSEGMARKIDALERELLTYKGEENGHQDLSKTGTDNSEAAGDAGSDS